MGNAIILRGGGGGVDCEGATATAANVLTGKTFGMDGADALTSGTMPNIGKQVSSIGAPTGSTLSVTIKKGYHNGSGYVSQSITEKGSPSVTLAINGSYTIPEGWYDGGSITQSITTQGATTLTGGTSAKSVSSGRYMTGNITIKGDSNLVAANIKSGVKIFSVTGTCTDYSASQEDW